MAGFPFYFLPYLIPLSVIGGLNSGGWWTFQTAFWIYVFIPLVDAMVGSSDKNPDPAAEPGRDRAPGFRLVLWLWVPIQVGFLVWALGVVASRPLTDIEFVGFMMSMGMTTGVVGITFGHELMHRTGRFERGLAEILMASVSYTHFCVEHVYGHHRRVATHPDPATARFGESLYAFLPRTIFTGVASAWRLEAARLRRRGLAVASRHNRMVRYGLCLAVVYAAVIALTGWKGALFFAGQGLVAVYLLEVINYIQHYGLVRKEISPGHYERVAPRHSWNSSHILTNLHLLNLPRHSDHHYQAGRRYQNLRHFEDVPQLPLGYAGMVVMAAIPPLWFQVMNPRTESWRPQPAAAE